MTIKDIKNRHKRLFASGFLYIYKSQERLNQKGVAAEAGVGQGDISNIVNGVEKKFPGLSKQDKIARVFNKTLYEIVGIGERLEADAKNPLDTGSADTVIGAANSKARKPIIIYIPEIVKRIQSVTGLNQKEVAEKVFDKTKNAFNDQIRANKIDWRVLLSWAVNKNLDLKWLLTGEGSVPDEKSAPGHASEPEPGYTASNRTDVIDIEHIDIIKKFVDKPRAKAADAALIELEKFDQAAFNETVGYIQGMAAHVRMAAERKSDYRPDRRRAIDRRQMNDDSKIPNNVDRRKGGDRRTGGHKT